ncbi:MAG TPA: V-type ATP synthase subunit A, partial [Clostridiales bacterium]|nr:V-type ATP synthase subunit A [Clostridiales bacterium]
DFLGTVQEYEIVSHRIMVPYGVSGKVEEISFGRLLVTDTVAVIVDDHGESHALTMMQKWP